MRNLPSVTKNLLIINLLFFFASIVAQQYNIDLNDLLGLHFFLAPDFRLYQLATYMFLHSGFAHIFFNMFALWMFGRILETTWGSKRFLIFYVFCGLGAGVIQEAVQYVHYVITLQPYEQVDFGGMIIPMSQYLNMLNTVGASGAIYGILLAFGMTYPNERLFIIPIPVPVKAKYLVMGYVAIELFTGLSNSPGDNVAHFAHLGGMLFGLILILYWRNHDKNGFRRF